MTDPDKDLPDRLLTAKQAATFLGYSEGTVRNKASGGELPFVKLGTSLRFRLSELEEWIEEQDEKGKAELAAQRDSTGEEVA